MLLVSSRPDASDSTSSSDSDSDSDLGSVSDCDRDSESVKFALVVRYRGAAFLLPFPSK